MNFEWDPAKSAANEEKHGIGFPEARALWEDAERLVVTVEHRGERREMLFASYAGSVWVAIFTMRGESVRIISARRATRREVSYYDRKRDGR